MASAPGKGTKRPASSTSGPGAASVSAGGFSGYWVCDKARSDSPRPHLTSLGLPELAIGAADKLGIALFIQHTPGRDISVAHMSELGVKERRFVLGEEFREASRDGGVIRFLVEQVSPTELATTVHMGQVRLAERKVLQAPDTMIQTVVMTISKPGAGGGSSSSASGAGGVSSTTTKVFVRQGDAPPPAQATPPSPEA